jgi:cytoskeleton protein RodZ
MLIDFIESLKAERTRRKLSLKALSGKTGISVHMLLALEAAEFDRFGAPVILRNVLRNYCTAFQVDPGPYLEKYAEEIASFDPQHAFIVEHGKRTRKLRRKRRLGAHSLLLLTIAAVGIIYGGIWISDRRARLAENEPLADRFFSQQDLPPDLQSSLPPPVPSQLKVEPVREEPASPLTSPLPVDLDRSAPPRELPEPSLVMSAPETAGEPEQKRAGLAPEPLPVAGTTEVMAVERPVAPAEGHRAYRLVVEAEEKTWIQVKIDDSQTRSIMLHPGDRREWQAERSMQIVIGNAGGVRMQWNGQPVRSPGGSGRVLRFRLPNPQYLEPQG